jgi:hypothetical protein
MPLARYFLYVGSVLLALLFIADACLPKPPAFNHSDEFRPVIRIYSDRGWPERVIYNTGLAMNPRVPTKISGPYIPAPERAADDAVRVREAFAALRPSDAKTIQPVHSAKPAPRQGHPRRTARRMPPPMLLVAQRQFAGQVIRMW